jgi:hypothetical protein
VAGPERSRGGMKMDFTIPLFSEPENLSKILSEVVALSANDLRRQQSKSWTVETGLNETILPRLATRSWIG